MPKQNLSKKIIHICIIFIIIIAILFTAIMFILKYDEKGETNMPFNLSKISIVSTSSGQDVENTEYKWAIQVDQNNDFNIYIEKNNKYKKQETIKSIVVDNFKVAEAPDISEIKIYKPIDNEVVLYKNLEENVAEKIEYIGSSATNNKKLEISNQGGVIQFRCANLNIGTYLSNDDEVINYNELIKKLNISEEEITAKISFDITINLDSGKSFKAENIICTIPNEGLTESGKQGNEITDLKDVVFKRIEN